MRTYLASLPTSLSRIAQKSRLGLGWRGGGCHLARFDRVLLHGSYHKENFHSMALHIFVKAAIILVVILGLTGSTLYGVTRTCAARENGTLWMQWGAVAIPVFSVVYGAYLALCCRAGRLAVFWPIVALFYNFIGLAVMISSFVCSAGDAPFNYVSIVFFLLLGAALLHFLVVPQGRIFPLLYRVLVVFPSSLYVTSIVVVFLCSPAVALLKWPAVSWIPWAAAVVLAGTGIYQMLVVRPLCDWDVVELEMPSLCSRPASNAHSMPHSLDIPRRKYGNGLVECSASTLRIVQIADPHLGSFMTPQRLYDLCQRIVSVQPDLVFLTGDFFTPEANNEPQALSYALTPLSQLAGKVFACLGNHDLESELVLERTRAGLAHCGAVLLVDESRVIRTRLGLVEIIGIKFTFNPASHIPPLFRDRSPRPSVIQTIVLLHDPTGFTYIPPLNALVLSGHTHGGYIGLFSLGYPHATVARLAGMLDNGFWTFRSNVLQVHRGQGARTAFANDVVRLGVPTEDVVLFVQPVGS